MSVHSNVGIRGKDGSDPNGSAKVSQGVDALAIPGRRETKGPDEIGNEEDDGRLVKTIEHIRPKLYPGIF